MKNCRIALITALLTNISSQAINTATVSINAEGINDIDTNTQGIYTFEDVPYGDFIISAVKTGYIQSSTTVTSSYFTNGLFGGEIEVDDIQLVAEEEEEEEPPPPADGTKKWEFATGGSIGSSPAIDTDGAIYIKDMSYKEFTEEIKPVRRLLSSKEGLKDKF